MKNSPLTRKTGLNRGTSQLSRRNARLRNMSPKQRRLYDKHCRQRAAYKSKRTCCICNEAEREENPLDVHEIFGGSRRTTTFGLPEFWLPAHRIKCHDILQGMSKEKQFAIKRRVDPTNYSLDRVNKVLGGNRFTEDMIV